VGAAVAIRSSTRITLSPGWMASGVHFHLIEAVFQRVAMRTVVCGSWPRLRTARSVRDLSAAAAEKEAARRDAATLSIFDRPGLHQLYAGGRPLCVASRVVMSRNFIPASDSPEWCGPWPENRISES